MKRELWNRGDEVLQDPDEIELEHGGKISCVNVAYETYGKINKEKSNAILVCHALSGDAMRWLHKGEEKPGWWDIIIGPGKALDTDQVFRDLLECAGRLQRTTGLLH